MTRSAWLRWLLGIGISVLFVWLAFRAIDPRAVWKQIEQADQRYLIPIVVFNLVAFVLRAWRWQLCFTAQDRLHLDQTATAYGVGVASSLVIPARLGDLVRAYVIGQVAGVSKSKALGTLVVERLSDMFAVVILLALLLPSFSLPSWIKVADGFAAGVAVVALIIVYVLAQRGEGLAAPAWVAGRRIPSVLFGILTQILAGFSAVRSARRGLLILAVSFAVWMAQIASYYYNFSAVHIAAGWHEAGLTTMVLALSAIIPAGPGFAGTFELAAQNLLGLFGVSRLLATSFIEYNRIPTLVSTIVFALGSFLILKLAHPRATAQTATGSSSRQPAPAALD